MKFLKRERKPDPDQRRRRQNQEGMSDKRNPFRRNVTLTGTRSDTIHSAAEERGQLQSARLEAQSRRKRRNKLFRRIVVAMLVIAIIIFAFANQISSYAIVVPEDVQRMPNRAAYQATAKEFSRTNLKNNFVFSVDTDQLAAFMRTKHPEIATATVDKSFFHRSPELQITLRKPVLRWQTRSDQHAFYVDAKGRAFTFNAFGNDESLVQVNDESGVPAELGAPIASSRQIAFLGKLVGAISLLSNGSLHVEKIVFPPSSTKQINVYLKGKPYYTKVYLDRAAKAQAQDLVNSVAYLIAKSAEPKEYIDVRTVQRAYYK